MSDSRSFSGHRLPASSRHDGSCLRWLVRRWSHRGLGMWTSEPLPPGAVMGRRRSIGSLEEDGRGTAVCAPPELSPVLAYFQSPDRLVRRGVARAPRLAVDAVPVEAGHRETELVTSATSSPAAESRLTEPRLSTQARPLRNQSANVTTPTSITTTQTTRDAPAKPPPPPSTRHASPRTHAVIDRIRSTGLSKRKPALARRTSGRRPLHSRCPAAMTRSRSTGAARATSGSATHPGGPGAVSPVPRASVAVTSSGIGTEPRRCSCTTDSSSSSPGG